MDHSLILSYAILVFIGSYVQATVGFAVAMIVAGGAALLDLASIAFTANVISFIGLTSSVSAVHGRYRSVDWRMVGAVSSGVIPCALLGLWLLFELSEHSIATLELILGGVIFLSGLSLIFHPHRRATESHPAAHAVAGGFGGLLMGLFSTGGPPVIMHIYRQPLAFHVARNTLLMVLSIMSITRLGAETVNGNITRQVLIVSLVAVPVSVLGVAAARRFQVPFGDETLRRLSFVLLAVLGLSLMGSRWP